MKIVRTLISALIVGVLFTQACSAKNYTPAQFEQAGLHYEDAKLFYAQLQAAVFKGDKQAVAQLIIYPFSATLEKGRSVELQGPEQFVKDYDLIMTDKVISSLKTTPFEALELHDVGAMTQGGIVWIGGTRLRSKNGFVHVIRVIAINGYWNGTGH